MLQLTAIKTFGAIIGQNSSYLNVDAGCTYIGTSPEHYKVAILNKIMIQIENP
jgi:hypothetical protein